jgi:predicted lactoylglutathione lyase
MAMATFINLPVKDLTKATEFFTKLGFSFDQQFTDENATRMIISDHTSVMLAAEPFFKGFITPQDITDTSKTREVIVGLSTESREQVDDLADKALAAGRRRWASRRTRASCTCAASATSTGINGRSSTWTCPRSRRTSPRRPSTARVLSAGPGVSG